MRLYHLSDENHDGEVFKPKVPDSCYQDSWGNPLEDVETRRVCFSRTIEGAFLSREFDDGYYTRYIHVPAEPEKLNPKRIHEVTEEEVPDGPYCDEVWVKQNVKLKCIGKIRIGYNHSSFENMIRFRPKVHFKYLEKYR
jgi:hypothetical protein